MSWFHIQVTRSGHSFNLCYNLKYVLITQKHHFRSKTKICAAFRTWCSDEKTGQNQNSGTTSAGADWSERARRFSLVRLTPSSIPHAGGSLPHAGGSLRALAPGLLRLPLALLRGRRRRCRGGGGWRGRGWFGFGMQIVQSQEVFRSHSVWIHWGGMQCGWRYWEEALPVVLRVLWGCGCFSCGLHREGAAVRKGLPGTNSVPPASVTPASSTFYGQKTLYLKWI